MCVCSKRHINELYTFTTTTKYILTTKQSTEKSTMMKHLAITMLILIIKLETSSAEPPDIFTRIVNIKNDLGGGIHLTTHCQSPDDDLGLRDLSNGRFTEWKFRVTLIGKTLYWCSMKWNDVVQAKL